MNPTRNTAKKTFLMKQIIGLELRFIRTQQKLNMSEAAAQSGISIKKIKSIEAENIFRYTILPSCLQYTALNHILS